MHSREAPLLNLPEILFENSKINVDPISYLTDAVILNTYMASAPLELNIFDINKKLV